VYHGFVRRGRFFTKSLTELILGEESAMHTMTKSPAKPSPNIIGMLQGDTLGKMMTDLPPHISSKYIDLGLTEVYYFDARLEGPCKRTEKIVE